MPDNNRASRGAMAYWFDIKPEVTEEWLHWYLHDHMPSRVGTAFVSGRCYERTDGDASHMVLFETSTPEDLLRPSYLALLGKISEEDRQRRGWYANPIRVTSRVLARSGRGTGGMLGVIRVNRGPHDAQALRLCLINEVLPAVSAYPRIGGAWLMEHDPELRSRMDAARVTGHQDGSTDWAILIEGGHDVDLAMAMSQAQETASWRALKLGEHAFFHRYRLLYTMSQADDIVPASAQPDYG